MGRCTLLNLNAKIFVTMDARGASPRETAVADRRPHRMVPSQSVILKAVFSSLFCVWMLTFAAMSPVLSADELQSLQPVSWICQKKSWSGRKKFAKKRRDLK
jgi:hypothetical protein